MNDQALCGLTGVKMYRCVFDPSVPNVCPECREEAVRNPPEPQPSGQEQLHEELEPAEGPLRDELRRLLRAGADVGPHIGGNSQSLAKSYVAFDQIVEGADEIRQVLAASGPISLWWAREGGRSFLVVAPRGGVPVVAVLNPDADPRTKSLWAGRRG